MALPALKRDRARGRKELSRKVERNSKLVAVVCLSWATILPCHCQSCVGQRVLFASDVCGFWMLFFTEASLKGKNSLLKRLRILFSRPCYFCVYPPVSHPE